MPHSQIQPGPALPLPDDDLSTSREPRPVRDEIRSSSLGKDIPDRVSSTSPAATTPRPSRSSSTACDDRNGRLSAFRRATAASDESPMKGMPVREENSRRTRSNSASSRSLRSEKRGGHEGTDKRKVPDPAPVVRSVGLVGNVAWHAATGPEFVLDDPPASHLSSLPTLFSRPPGQATPSEIDCDSYPWRITLRRPG